MLAAHARDACRRRCARRAAAGRRPPRRRTTPTSSPGESGTLGRRTPRRGGAATWPRTLVGAARAARRCVRAARSAAPAARARASRRAPGVRGRRGDRRGASSSAPATRRRPPRRRRARARASGRTSTPRWRRTRPTGYDWLLVVDDDVVLPRGFLDPFLFCCERFGFALAQPAPRLRLARRLAGHAAPARAASRAARASWRSGPVTAIHRERVRRCCCRSPTCRWAGAWTPTGARSPRGTGWPVGRRRRDARPPHAARRRRTTRATRRSRRRGRFLADRPYVAPRRGAADARGAPAGGEPRARRRRRGVLPARGRPGPRACGRTARRSPRATPAPTCAVLVLHRPVPSRAALASREPRRLLEPLRQPLRATLDGIDVTYVPFVAPPRPRSYGAWGAWAAPPLAVALRRLRRGSPTTSSTRTTPRRPATPSAARGPATPYVVSVHGGDVLARGAAPRAAGARAVRRGLGGARARARQLRGASPTARRDARRARRRPRRAPRHRRARPRSPAPERAASSPSATSSPRKRHADVLRALWLLRDRRPDLTLGRRRRRAGARGAASASRASWASRTACSFRGALAPARGGRGSPSRPRASSCPASTRRSASPTSRRWPAASPRSAAAREPGPEEIAARGRRHVPRPARGPRARSPAAIDALLDDERDRLRVGAAARRRSQRALHLGALRPRDRRRLRGGAAVSGDPRPVLFVTNHAPAYRVGAFAALHAREDVELRADRRRTSATAAAGPADADAAVPASGASPSARSLGLAASGAYRAVVAGALRPRRAARPPTSGARRARVPFVLWATIWAHPRTAAHALVLPAAAPHLPRRRRDRHLRPARHRPTSAPRARAARCSRRRRRSTTPFWSGAGDAAIVSARYQALFVGRLAGEKGLAVLFRPGAPRASSTSQPRWFWSAGDGSEPRPPPPARCSPRCRCRPTKSATSTRAATLSSCRRSPRATSASRGGSSSTKPSTRESP